MKIELARQLLIEVMHKYFTDKTFGHYIANELAGDFAAELAEAFIAAQTADRAAGGECCDWVQTPLCLAFDHCAGLCDYGDHRALADGGHKCPHFKAIKYKRVKTQIEEEP